MCKTVLITGGASGIGLCLAEEFLRAKHDVIITDINVDALTKAIAKLQHLGNLKTFINDVSNKKDVFKLADLLRETNIDVLINNAGIGYSGEIYETTLDKWEQLIKVNLLGPLNFINAFLPQFAKRGSGHIVNVSSGQSFFRLPTWGAYASVKAALGCLSEVMRYELRKLNIKVTTVYPFMVNTPFYKDIKGDTFGSKLSMKLLPYYSMSPEKVARIIFKAIEKEKAVEMVSVFNTIGKTIQAIPFVPSVIGTVSSLFLGKKAKALLEHLDEMKEWITQQEKHKL